MIQCVIWGMSGWVEWVENVWCWLEDEYLLTFISVTKLWLFLNKGLIQSVAPIFKSHRSYKAYLRVAKPSCQLIGEQNISPFWLPICFPRLITVVEATWCGSY